MSRYNSSKRLALCDEPGGISGPDPSAGCEVVGGISGPDPSALTAGTEAHSAAAITHTNVSLFISLPPFLKIDEQDSIALNPADVPSLFARFWDLRCAGRYGEAFDLCDLILELIPFGGAGLRLRHSNAYAMALRDLCDLRGAYRAHLQGRPFLAEAPAVYVGDHYHGLGVTLSRMGTPFSARAYKAFLSAREFHAGDAVRLAHTDINTAELLARMGKTNEAHGILDAVTEPTLRASVYVARARTFEAEGDTANARRSLADAQFVLADSADAATRSEALELLDRIEGKAGAL